MLGVDADTMSRGALSNDIISTYTALMNEGQLTTRTGILLNFANFCAPYRTSFELMQEYLNYVAFKPGFGNDMLRVSGIKIGADWTHFDGTAWMYDPYLPSGQCGSLNLVGETDEEKVEQLQKLMEFAHRRRWSIGIHAIGDRTTDLIADNFAKLMSEDPWDARHYLIHGLFLTPEAAEKMARSHVGISVQSAWLWHYFYADQELPWIGQERFDYVFPLRMMLDAGLIVSNGADAPETEPDWRRGVEAAVCRVSKLTGEARNPEQAITVEEALRTYTINGAYLDHQDHVKGSIESGKVADFCIIGEDILAVEPETIPDIPILMTILNGDVVYDSDDLQIA
jgi:predicted amidohydrolase YtcJ